MFKKGKGGVKIVHKKVVSLPKVGGHKTHDNIIPKPVFTDSLPYSSTDVDVKINGIAIGTIRQHPEFIPHLVGLSFMNWRNPDL